MTPESPLVRAIREYLERTGESERALSERAGLNHKAVNQILNGKTETNRGSTLIKLAEAMGVEVETLLKSRNRDRPTLLTESEPGENSIVVHEYDVGASAGHGFEQPIMEGDGSITPILAEWKMPLDLVRAHTTPDRQLALIRVEGDSMEPDYRPGERVLVDLSRKKPSPPGVFVVWDGMGLVLKRVELVPGTGAKRIRLSSINAGYQPYEIDLDEHTIVARVIGKWQWR